MGLAELDSRSDTPFGINNAWDRFLAWTHLLIADHGIFRIFYLNRREIAPGIWRSAQPAPHNIRRWAVEGIKTVICLRINCHRLRELEMTACRKVGLDYRELPITASDVLKPSDVEKFSLLFRDIKYPAVMHCKTGVDRAGVAAALFLLIEENADSNRAKRQLSLRYGHIGFGKKGIARAALEVFCIDQAKFGGSFFDWAQTVYDPDATRSEFLKWRNTPLYNRIACGNWRPRYSGSGSSVRPD